MTMRFVNVWSVACIALLGPLRDEHQDRERDDSPSYMTARGEVIRSALAVIGRSLVTIETIGGAQPVRQVRPGVQREESFRVADGPTTGLVLSGDGLIVTSSFNFVRDPSVITVTLSDGRRFVGKLLGRDLIRRLALLRIDARDLPVPVWLGRSDLHIGQYLIACGRGLPGNTPHVSLGILSALERRNGNALQTDAKTSPVNYGGPLIDIEGRVAGIIVPMAGEGGALAGVEWYDSGIAFAIYKDRIDAVFERLLAGQTIEPGKIGVVLTPDEPGESPFLEKLWAPAGGVRISRVARKSPAAAAGLQVGDKIMALDGRPIAELGELQRRLSDRAAGETVRLTIRRQRREFDAPITLARLADIEGFEDSADAVPEDARPRPPDDQPEEPTSRPAAD